MSGVAMSGKPDNRLMQAIYAIPRSAFIASPDLGEMMSGHSIPSRATVKSVLARIPSLRDSDRVLLVGAGSGYLAMILSRLVANLLVIERDASIADIARKNIAAFKPGNLTLRVVGGDELRTLAEQIRDLGLGATIVRGEGRAGERLLLFCFMPKKCLRKVKPHLEAISDRVFYTLDYGGSSNKILLEQSAQPASPRRFFKRK